MKRTVFTGLTQLSAGDPLNIDGGSFKDRNIATIDQYLERIITHKHDGSGALVNPTLPPTVSVIAASGHVPPLSTASVAYTMLDGLGGETAISPAVTVVTPAGIGAAASAASGAILYTSGSLQIGHYQYVYTLIDGIGGETPASPPLALDRLSGHASGVAVISGMSTVLAAHPTAAGWRFYRSANGSPYSFIQAGTSDGWSDTGLISVVSGTRPPVYDTTSQTGSISVTVPTAALTSASGGFNLYLSTIAGSFYSPSLQGSYPQASGNVPITLTTLAVVDGSPPPVSTAVSGSNLIDESAILNLQWEPPVAASGRLGAGVVGDVALDEATGNLYAVLGSSSVTMPTGWTKIGTPASGFIASAGNSFFIGAHDDASTTADVLTFLGASGTTVSLSRIAATPGQAAQVAVTIAASGSSGGGGAAAITDSGWISVSSFGTGWSNGGSVAYRKIANRVQLRGLLTNGGGGVGSVAFTLPTGYRPPGTYNPIFPMPAVAGGGESLAQINADGTVSPGSVAIFMTSPTFPALDGISFLTD